MSNDERTFWMAFEKAKEEVESWPSWKQAEVVDIYSRQASSSNATDDESAEGFDD